MITGDLYESLQNQLSIQISMKKSNDVHIKAPNMLVNKKARKTNFKHLPFQSIEVLPCKISKNSD